MLVAPSPISESFFTSATVEDFDRAIISTNIPVTVTHLCEGIGSSMLGSTTISLAFAAFARRWWGRCPYLLSCRFRTEHSPVQLGPEEDSGSPSPAVFLSFEMTTSADPKMRPRYVDMAEKACPFWNFISLSCDVFRR
jgi:hypothetical protein